MNSVLKGAGLKVTSFHLQKAFPERSTWWPWPFVICLSFCSETAPRIGELENSGDLRRLLGSVTTYPYTKPSLPQSLPLCVLFGLLPLSNHLPQQHFLLKHWNIVHHRMIFHSAFHFLNPQYPIYPSTAQENTPYFSTISLTSNWMSPIKLMPFPNKHF